MAFFHANFFLVLLKKIERKTSFIKKKENKSKKKEFENYKINNFFDFKKTILKKKKSNIFFKIYFRLVFETIGLWPSNKFRSTRSLESSP